eukprot:COSAG01_NODE_15142_length_1369_cov_4.401907_2_plen_150_part_00
MSGLPKQYNIMVLDSIITKWQAEVDTLKPRKRKNWKGSLTNKQGVKSKVKFEDGKFWNWSFSTIDNLMKWCEVIPQSQMFASIDKHQPTSETSLMIHCAHHLHSEGMLSTEQRDGMIDATLERTVKANHTGNHYRNHITKVGSNIYGHK